MDRKQIQDVRTYDAGRTDGQTDNPATLCSPEIFWGA
jgi:hypothetical protein